MLSSSILALTFLLTISTNYAYTYTNPGRGSRRRQLEQIRAGRINPRHLLDSYYDLSDEYNEDYNSPEDYHDGISEGEDLHHDDHQGRNFGHGGFIHDLLGFRFSKKSRKILETLTVRTSGFRHWDRYPQSAEPGDAIGTAAPHQTPTESDEDETGEDSDHHPTEDGDSRIETSEETASEENDESVEEETSPDDGDETSETSEATPDEPGSTESDEDMNDTTSIGDDSTRSGEEGKGEDDSTTSGLEK